MRGGVPSPFLVWGGLSRFVCLVQRRLRFACFPLLFAVVLVFVWFCFRDLVSLLRCQLSLLSLHAVARGRVAIVAVWTPLSPKYSKVTDRVTMSPVAFGSHVGFCIESCCCGLPCLLFVLDSIWSGWFGLICRSAIFFRAFFGSFSRRFR